ncbi:hypothetical protein CKO51_07115 [Rhodopirellula sp. SM50]|nr:hypothetical protein CKO51_07115 [Rhodopirellula sp. SM50]
MSWLPASWLRASWLRASWLRASWLRASWLRASWLRVLPPRPPLWARSVWSPVERWRRTPNRTTAANVPWSGRWWVPCRGQACSRCRSIAADRIPVTATRRRAWTTAGATAERSGQMTKVRGGCRTSVRVESWADRWGRRRFGSATGSVTQPSAAVWWRPRGGGGTFSLGPTRCRSSRWP